MAAPPNISSQQSSINHASTVDNHACKGSTCSETYGATTRSFICDHAVTGRVWFDRRHFYPKIWSHSAIVAPISLNAEAVHLSVPLYLESHFESAWNTRTNFYILPIYCDPISVDINILPTIALCKCHSYVKLSNALTKATEVGHIFSYCQTVRHI
jgi:hypothetical protein